MSRVSSGARSSGRSSASASGARGSEDSDGVREVRESTVTFSASLSPVEGSGSLPPPLPAPPPPSHCFAATTTTMTVSFSASGASDFTRDQIDGIKAAFASELDDGAVDVQVKVVHRHVRRALRRVWGICTQFTRGSLSAVEDTTVEVTLRKIGVGDIDAFKAKLSARLGLDERSSAADDEPGAGASLFLKERGLRASSGAEVAVTSAPIVETPAGRLDDLLDNICFVQTVFFSMQIATSWRVSLKMLVKTTSGGADSGTLGGVLSPASGTTFGAVLLVTELCFMLWYYVAIRHKEWARRLLGINADRLKRRVDYVTDRFRVDVPWWQLAVWVRQVTLTIVIHLPAIVDALSHRRRDVGRPVTWVHAILALVILVACWVWHSRVSPWVPLPEQARVVALLVGRRRRPPRRAVPVFGVDLGIPIEAVDTLGWVMFAVVVGAMLIRAVAHAAVDQRPPRHDDEGCAPRPRSPARARVTRRCSATRPRWRTSPAGAWCGSTARPARPRARSTSRARPRPRPRSRSRAPRFPSQKTSAGSSGGRRRGRRRS